MKALFAVMSGVALMTGFSTTALGGEKYLFYIHGCCIKGSGDAKVKAYETIVQDLKNAGFNVSFDLRYSSESDNDAGAQAYAAKVAEQVKALLAKGVAPGDITVSGYSLGSMTTMVASGLIDNPKVNYVLLAGCPTNASIKVNIDYTKVKGRILSIVDSKDDKFGSCNGRFPGADVFNEIARDSGQGHKLFQLTDAESYALWKAPLESWANGK
jgi:hypothetical protein